MEQETHSSRRQRCRYRHVQPERPPRRVLEKNYLTKGYHPVYVSAADLSLEQVNVITKTLASGKKDRPRRVRLLAEKVRSLLSIKQTEGNDEKFLQTLLRDYQYYALEEI